MSDRSRISSGTKWERTVGYCRALQVGQTIYVAGTVAVDDAGQTVAPNDMAGQLRFVFDKMDGALQQLGSGLKDVVKTTMFVTDISALDAVGQVHGSLFADHPPVSTCVEVAALVRPELVVEAEVVAVMPS